MNANVTIAAGIDSLAMSLTKEAAVQNSLWPLFGAVSIAAIQYYLLFRILQTPKETLVVNHVVFDLLSVVFVTIIGLLYYKETITLNQSIGLVAACVAIYMLSSAE